MDDPIWKESEVLRDFVQTFPGDNIAPSKPTEVYIGYDAKHLYIAFKCFDESDKIRATLAKRDNVFGDDNVRVYLDTYDDQRRAYVLGFNPLGIQQDGIYTEEAGTDYSADIVMESKGLIEDWGWSVEVRIPFKSLRYSAGKGKLWGFNSLRNIKRLNDEVDSWMPISREISGQLVQAGKITGFDQIGTERTLEIIPSLTLSETGNRTEGNRFVNQPVKPEIGVNIKYTITPNITLDAAINPDFAEIEADAPVITANQRFPIFFTEKRPFFLEGADIFRSPLLVFNSRAIFDPVAALKLTGKVGRNTFGFLSSVDNKRNIEARSYAAVVRLKRDFGKENNLGFFGTTNHFPNRHNTLGGFDGRFKLNTRTTFDFQMIGTTTRGFFYDPETDENKYRTGNGFAYFGRFDFSSDTHGLRISAEGRTRDYRADIGFTRRTNANSLSVISRLSTRSKPAKPLIRLDWVNIFNFGNDWQGRSQNWGYNTNFDFTLQQNTVAHIETGFAFERLFEEEFGAKRNSLGQDGAFFGPPERSAYRGFIGGFVNKQFNKKFFAGGFFSYTFNRFDFDFGAGPKFPRVSPAALLDPNAPLDPGTGSQLNIELDLDIKPTEELRVSISFDKSRFVRNDTNLVAFDTNVFSSRVEYHFSRFVFIRSRWDYDTLSANIRGQLLFGWNPNPGTAFFIGYNDALRYQGFNQFTGRFSPGFERDSRTFFIRASYLFRKSF
ncbi:MAG: DUF5916 domain-containing protein [Pyrinomonadaceae bacterium]